MLTVVHVAIVDDATAGPAALDISLWHVTHRIKVPLRRWLTEFIADTAMKAITLDK